MKRVLVTGASGFIGRLCLPRLEERGFEVYALTSKKAPVSHIRWIQYDLLQERSLKEVIAQIAPTHLLHLAWNVVPGKFWTARENLDWLKASIDLVEAFASHGGKRAVVAGTCAEYDWNLEDFSEQATPRPHSLYGSCKLSLHLLLDALSKQLGFSSAHGRIFFVYGPYEDPKRLVPTVINGLLKREPVLCSHGNQIRDFLHVEDVADAFAALLDSEVQGPINIGSGERTSVKQLIKKIAQRIGGEELVQLGALAASPTDPSSLIADVTRLKNELKWEPKFTLDSGLQQTIEWWQQIRPISKHA